MQYWLPLPVFSTLSAMLWQLTDLLFAVSNGNWAPALAPHSLIRTDVPSTFGKPVREPYLQKTLVAQQSCCDSLCCLCVLCLMIHHMLDFQEPPKHFSNLRKGPFIQQLQNILYVRVLIPPEGISSASLPRPALPCPHNTTQGRGVLLWQRDLAVEITDS